MEDFITSLVREKMTFNDTAFAGDDESGATVRSNRLLLKLYHKDKVEKVAVRTQTMHTTLLLASKIMFSYFKNGLFSGRADSYDWDTQWDAVLSDYERKYNPNIWAVIYVDGNPVFRTKEDPYLDIVEKCAVLNADNYDATIGVTETALRQVGKSMRIDHATHVAAVFTDVRNAMKCGIVHRVDGKNTTFNFTAAKGDWQRRIVQTLVTAAAFLEALNLRLVVRDLQGKIRRKEITTTSPEAARLRSAAARGMLLHKSIGSFEGMYEVKYHPAKPDLFYKEE